jgi:hypothetical protein
MKQTYLLLPSLLLAGSLFAQTPFWIEDFGTGCDRAQSPTMYIGSNGQWMENPGLIAGGNDPHSNHFYVSATVAGTGAGNCAGSCINSSITDRSLHISNPSFTTPFGSVNADTGCTYLTGAFSILGINSTSNYLATSPIINCTGRANISVTFLYIEGGATTLDNASFAYSSDGGTTWTILDDMLKTGLGTCLGLSGPWTSHAIPLPASANNNANVRIGFNWTSNNDGNGTDPSFAVDDISLIEATMSIGGNSTVEPLIYASGNEVLVQSNGANCALESVTDISGRVIDAQLSNNRIQLPSTPGIYFVTLQINGVQTVRKFLIH